jgi:TPR repeat protein
VYWYRQAALQGDPVGEYDVGVAYDNGLGVTQNADEAAHWYQLAASQGEPDAAFNLGMDYQQGLAMPVDDIQAYRWFEIAAASPNASDAVQQNAIQAEETISANMSSDDIAQATELAEEFAPQLSASN